MKKGPVVVGLVGAGALALAAWPGPWRLVCAQFDGDGDPPPTLAALPTVESVPSCRSLDAHHPAKDLTVAVRTALLAATPEARRTGLDWPTPVEPSAAEGAFRLLIDGAAGPWPPRRTALVLRYGERAAFVGPERCRERLPELADCLGL